PRRARDGDALAPRRGAAAGHPLPQSPLRPAVRGLARAGARQRPRRGHLEPRAPQGLSVLLYTHPACLEHDPGPGHPECPARLEAVLHAVRTAFPALEWRQAPEASRDMLLRVHTRELVSSVLDLPVDGLRRLDEDTMLSPGSPAAALRAAGAAVAAVDAVMRGDARQAFCAVRPPGHHATAGVAMGFCLFNSAAVAAAHAVHAHGLHRVAIADFDVHHGNGSQAIFGADPRVMYLSSHQAPLYPHTGEPGERGVG